MRIFILPLSVTALVVIFILSIPFFFPQRKNFEYDDKALREAALSRAMTSVETTTQGLEKTLKLPKNEITSKKIALGEKLFFESTLSASGKISCSTCHPITSKKERENGVLLPFLLDKNSKTTDCAACHQNDKSGVDRFTFAQGEGEDPHLLNTTSIFHSASLKYFGWGGETESLEEWIAKELQKKGRIGAKDGEIGQKLSLDSFYKNAFMEVFGESPTIKNISNAIGSYIKTLHTRSAYDRFLDGDNNALSIEAKRGLSNFINFGCKGCHTGVAVGGQSLQKFPLRKFARIHDLRPNFELYPEIKRIDNKYPFENIGGFEGKNENQIFRVPSLRNVSKTSPYFHNGSIMKLREAVDIMARHQLGLNLSSMELDDIVEFLRSLDGEIVEYDFGLNNVPKKGGQ